VIRIVLIPPDNECGVAAACMHLNYDEGQRLQMKGGQRRTSRLAEIGEMVLFEMLASAEMRYL
jgi:hypothetical protein